MSAIGIGMDEWWPVYTVDRGPESAQFDVGASEEEAASWEAATKAFCQAQREIAYHLGVDEPSWLPDYQGPRRDNA
jgi:hypothetical protein